MIAWPILRNSQVTAREAEASAVFTSLPYCWSFQPQKHGSPIWSLTQLLLGADKPTISHLKEEILSYQWVQNFWIFLIDGYKLSQVQISHFQHGFGMLRGLPTSLFILLCHSVTAWSISSSYVSSKRGLKYLSYDLKYPHTRFFIWPYEHQSYSYPDKPRTPHFILCLSTGVAKRVLHASLFARML